MMSIVQKCGHDTRGNEVYIKNSKDEEVLDEEFSKVSEIYNKYPNRVIKAETIQHTSHHFPFPLKDLLHKIRKYSRISKV